MINLLNDKDMFSKYLCDMVRLISEDKRLLKFKFENAIFYEGNVIAQKMEEFIYNGKIIKPKMRSGNFVYWHKEFEKGGLESFLSGIIYETLKVEDFEKRRLVANILGSLYIKHCNEDLIWTKFIESTPGRKIMQR